MTSKVTIFVLVYLLSLGHIQTIRIAHEGIRYWGLVGAGELKEAIDAKPNENIAKNVIIFIGDGMGLPTVTSARIYSKTEKGFLAWEKFEHTGLLKTYSYDKLVPDSASTANAIFSGVKINQRTLGVDGTVKRKDCEASLDPYTHTTSVLQWAMEAGKATGLVTTTRVTHATPAALYAHTPYRKWECEALIPKESKKCKDIARQLIEDSPGKNIKVIMGGGRQVFQSNSTETPNDLLDHWSCISQDGRDLIGDWAKDKKKRKVSHVVVKNNKELQNLDDSTEFVLGIFTNGHLPRHYLRNKGPEGTPSLRNMTEKAIRILKKNKNGFFLMVESGQIDMAHHRGRARQALDETVALSDAVDVALSLVDTKDTLVIVTSDHSHSLMFLGYLERNNSILGVLKPKSVVGEKLVPHTPLLYGIGGKNNFQFEVVDGKPQRRDPSQDDTTSNEYSQQTGILQDQGVHAGEDIVIYATGPMSHLVHSVREQTFVAYLMSYAAQLGPMQNIKTRSDGIPVCSPFHVVLSLVAALIVYIIS